MNFLFLFMKFIFVKKLKDYFLILFENKKLTQLNFTFTAFRDYIGTNTKLGYPSKNRSGNWSYTQVSKSSLIFNFFLGGSHKWFSFYRLFLILSNQIKICYWNSFYKAIYLTLIKHLGTFICVISFLGNFLEYLRSSMFLYILLT